MADRRYRAFISYRHADNAQEGRRWAEWMHRALERYVVPPDLVGTTNLRGDVIPESLYPIFRDEDELPANADLAKGIRAALEVTDHLIVLCSPRSAVSPWVRKEVREFKELGRSDRILAVMISGEPNADDPAKVRTGVMPEEECFCEELRFGVPRDNGTIDWTARTEPLAADLRPGGLRAEGFVSADAYRQHLMLSSALATEKIRELAEAYHARLEHGLLKVIAGLLGVPLSQLTERDAAHRAAVAEKEAQRQREIAEKERVNAERLRRRNRILAVAAAVIFGLAIAAGLLWRSAEAERARAEAGENAANTAQANEKVQREEVAKRDQEKARLLHDASMADYAVAVQRIERDGKWSEGVAHLARALRWENSNKLAATRLYSTLSLHGSENQSWPRLILRHEDGVNSAQFSPDGSRVVTASDDKTARLWDAATGKSLGEPLRHEDNVSSAHFSPDGSRVVTASDDKTARLWDAATGKPLGEPLRHEDGVDSAQFSPDGSRVVTASRDKTARLWDAATGKPLGEPLRHERPVYSAQFSPDGSRILTTGGDNTARLWDAATGKLLDEFLGHEDNVFSAQFSPDGSRIVTASRDKTARLWDAATGKPLGEPLRHKGSVSSAQFSPDGSRILTTGDDNTARLWDAATGKPSGELLWHEGYGGGAVYSPDGSRILFGSADDTVRLWDAATGKPLGEPLRHDGVNNAQFSPDGSRIITTSSDNTARLWDVATGKPLGEPLRHGLGVNSAQFSPDGSRVVTASQDNTARLWDAATSKPLSEPLEHEGTVNSAQFSPDGSRIVTASWDNTARLWDAATGRPLGEPLRHEGSVSSAQFSPDGSRIVTASDDKTARLWDAATGKPLGEPLRHEDNVSSAQFSPDGSRVVTASDDKTARLWDATTGKPLGEPLRHEDNVSSAQFSPDGSRVVTASTDGTARLWDAATGQPLGEPLRHERPVYSAQFSPDGSRILTTGGDNTARLWDAATCQPLGEPLRHEDYVSSAQFSPDGSRVVTASTDGTARLWDAATSQPLGEPLRHEGGFHSAQFSPDGSRIVTGCLDYTARLWEAVAEFAPPELWFLDRARAVAGLDFTSDGKLVPMDCAKRLETMLAPIDGEDRWAKLARWLAQTAEERPITPNSRFTRRQIAERERDSGGYGLVFALQYDSTIPLARLLLAAHEENAVRAEFLREYDLRHMPDDARLWVRASTALRAQRQVPRAIETARKAAALEPGLPDGQRALAEALEDGGRKAEALEIYERLLAGGEATDFATAGSLAAQLGRDMQAREIFRKAEEAFPRLAYIVQIKGWAMLNLGAPAEALGAFQRYEPMLEPGAEPDPNAIAGLSVSRWATGNQDGGVDDYQRLIELAAGYADADAIAKSDYSEDQKRLLLEVLAETLKRHPELKPKEQ